MSIKILLKKIHHLIGLKNLNFEKTSLCGVPLKVLPGCVRKAVDQDDAWWFYLAKNHDCIFDVGCNVGYTALLGLIQNPHLQMILVDPNPEALQKAAVNLIGNGMGKKVSFYPAFVGKTTGETIDFYTVGSGAAGSMYATHAETAAKIGAQMKVETVTIDYLYYYYKLSPDLIKIDVEGAETLVMEGSKETALSTQCSFFIEMHDIEEQSMKQATEYMLDWSKKMNYNVWYLKTGEKITSSKTVAHRGKCHLLLMHNSKLYPSYLKGVEQFAPLPNTV